jgi:hypothetical protein
VVSLVLHTGLRKGIREVESSHGYSGVFPANGAGIVKDADFERSFGKNPGKTIDDIFSFVKAFFDKSRSITRCVSDQLC